MCEKRFDKMKELFTQKNLKLYTKHLPLVRAQIHSKNISLIIKANHVLPVSKILKNHVNFQYKILTSLTVVDYPKSLNRFCLVYELLSLKFNNRLKIKIFTSELNPIDTLQKEFLSAGWYESEAWDMFGVFFLNHSNLSRLLTDYGFEGYPLRKDFPLSGYTELSYSYKKKYITNVKLGLTQKYMLLDTQSPWKILPF